MMTAAFISIACAGVLLLWLGVRGRRLDDHPVCRGCRYDLSGLVAPANCPECGTDLAKKRRVRIGQRRRRPIIITIGLLLLAGGVAMTALDRMPADLTPYKPSWLLTADLDRGGAQTESALGELTRRARDGRLSQRLANRVADMALRLQADASVTWDPLWGDFIEAAWLTKIITEDRYDAFIHTGWQSSIAIEVRSEIRAGGPFPYRLHISADRFGSGGKTFAKPPRVSVMVNNETVRVEAIRWAYSRAAWFTYGDHLLPVALEPGRVTLSFEFDLPDRFPKNVVVVPVEIDVAERDAQLVTLLPDASVEAAIRDSITVTIGSSRLPEARGGMVWFDRPPVNVAFDVYVRHMGEEHIVGSAASPTFLHRGHLLHTHPWDHFPPASHVDFVFRASKEAAERSIDIDEAWEGEIVIENVPVIGPTRAENAESPTP